VSASPWPRRIVRRTRRAASAPPSPSRSEPEHAMVLPLRSCRRGRESAIPTHMRMLVLPALLSLTVFPSLTALPCAAAQATDPAVLEQAWRDCVREAFAHQSPAQGRAGSQRNALDECKAREDAV